MMLMKSTVGMVIGLVVVLAGMTAEGQEPPELVTVPDNPRLETVTERYPNGNIKVEREVVQDDAGNYVNHGTYKMYDLDGEILKTGEFQNGKQHGRWVQNFAEDKGHLFAGEPQKEFEGPFVSEATFVDGKLHGNWTIKDRDGQNIVEWSFSHGDRSGKWTWWHSNGQIWLEVAYENGAFNGELLERDPNGKLVAQSTYIEGRHLVKDVKWFALGQKQFEGAYLRVQTVPQPVYDWWPGTSTPPSATPTGKDQRHGVWIAWYRNGNKKTEGKYDHDVPIGKFAWWFENGQKQAEGEYGAGLKSGTWATWHPNGLRESQVTYVNGKRIGTWMRWDAEGKLVGMRDFNIADSENATKKSAKKNRADSAQRPSTTVHSRR